MNRPAPERLPPYARHLLAFGFMNAVCYTIALGAPMVLCARYLGASESLVGFLLALTPLFTALQLPAARYADLWGYQRLMMAGWRTRAYMVLLMAPLPLLAGRFPGSLLLFTFTVLGIAFNAIRGFASGAWNPWLKQMIVPEQLGRYIAIESIVANIAALLTLLACGLVLGHNPGGYHYAALLLLSGLAGVFSVLPLGRAPATPPPETPPPRERMRTVARRVWANAEYRRLIRFATMNSFALGGVAGFNVLFFKEIVGIGEGRVVFLTALGLIGAMTGAFFLGRYVDRTGSRPVMRVAGIGHLAFFAFLTVYAALGAPFTPLLLGIVVALGGIIGNAAGVAGGRLILNTCPREDLTVAMAISQVAQSLSAGLATVLWGFLLEWMRAPEAFGHDSRWPFFLFYVLTFALVGISQLLLHHVREARAISTDRFIRALLVEWPQRMWDDLRR